MMSLVLMVTTLFTYDQRQRAGGGARGGASGDLGHAARVVLPAVCGGSRPAGDADGQAGDLADARPQPAGAPARGRGAGCFGMYLLRGYLVVAVLMLLVKAIQLGLGHH